MSEPVGKPSTEPPVKPPKPPKDPKGVRGEVTEHVTLDVAGFDAGTPLNLDKAADAFKQKADKLHGAKTVKIKNVKVIEHHVGSNATYEVTGDLAD